MQEKITEICSNFDYKLRTIAQYHCISSIHSIYKTRQIGEIMLKAGNLAFPYKHSLTDKFWAQVGSPVK